jgi:putative inorganic carbon (hco3(-)) transporter
LTRWDTESGGGGPSFLLSTGLALAFATTAAAALILIALGPKQVAFSVVATFLLLAALVSSGNPRLFSLWCLLLTAPLGIKKAFLVRAHMGGASAVTIDGCDPFLAILLIFILRDVAAGRRELRWGPSVLVLWGGLMVLGLLDMVSGPLRQLAFLEIVRMLKVYLLFFVIINEIVRTRQFMHAVAAIVCGIVLQGVVTIIQYVSKASLGLQFLGEPGKQATESATQSVYLGAVDVYRAGGLFEHANLLAGYLAMLLPICIALLFSRVGPPVKAAVGGAVVLGLVCLAITLSRSGWISFATGFALLFLLSLLHQKLRLRYMLARLLVIMGVIGGIAFESGDIIRRFTESDPGAVKFRWDMVYTAFDMIMAHPVFGIGLNTFVARFPEYANPPGPEAVTAKYGEYWPVVHNSYLVTWTEQGIIGVALLVALYLSVLWTGARTARHMIDDRMYAINLGATCGIVAIMVDGLSSFFIDESASERVFFLVVGLIFALNYWTKANLAMPRGSTFPQVPAAAGA